MCVCLCVCPDGRAFAVGGMGSDLLPRSILQQYDLRKDMWGLLPPMPTPRYDANINLHGSKLYVAGGFGSTVREHTVGVRADSVSCELDVSCVQTAL